MKKIKKVSGSLTALAFCILTLPIPFLLLEIPISAIELSSLIEDFVKSTFVNQDLPGHCELELIWIYSIYLITALLIAVIFSFCWIKKKWGLGSLILLLMLEFYILQTPFFIFEVGTYYNCKVDGQTILGIWISSPKVSCLLIGFGILYDVIRHKFRV